MTEHASVFSKSRMEGLSDGLFAIAMTLLVLEIKVPAGAPPEGGYRLFTGGK